MAPGLQPGQVSRRELQVLALLATGRSRADVGERLCLSASTVKTHLYRIYGRLGVHTAPGAVAVVMRRREIWPSTDHACDRPTVQQLLVLQGCANDRSNGEIAAALFVSIQTVKTHLLHSAERLRVRGRTAQVAVALSQGWID